MSSKIDITGQRFGSLVAIEPDYSRKTSNLYWWFQCDCGKKVSIMGKNVRKGITQSCGCSRINNLLDQKFGMLTVIAQTDKRKNRHVVWKCKCQCGNIIEVNSHDLMRQAVFSCGCQKISLGENKIKTILEENNISFIREYTFDDCRFIDTSALAKFDFYVANSYLVEFDGVGHYQGVEFFGGDKAFQKQQQHDEFKNQWCKEHNIPLIRIPYTHYNDLRLEDLMLETSTYIV